MSEKPDCKDRTLSATARQLKSLSALNLSGISLKNISTINLCSNQLTWGRILSCFCLTFFFFFFFFFAPQTCCFSDLAALSALPNVVQLMVDDNRLHGESPLPTMKQLRLFSACNNQIGLLLLHLCCWICLIFFFFFFFFWKIVWHLSWAQ